MEQKDSPKVDNDLQWVIKYFEEKFSTRDRDLEKQAKEYERRLNDLNHENARILAAQDRSVSLDKFDGAIGQVYSKLDEVKKELAALNDFKQKQEGKGQGGKDIMDIIKLVIIIAGFFIAYFVIKK